MPTLTLTPTLTLAPTPTPTLALTRPETIGHQHSPAAAAEAAAAPACYSAAPTASRREAALWSRGWQPDVAAAAQHGLAATAAKGVPPDPN